MKKKKENYENVEGIWRTIGGRKVFIRKGQSLSDAMKESGKFKTGNRREVQQAIAEKKVDKLGKKNTELYRKFGGFADTGDKEKNKEVNKAHKKWLANSKEANDLKAMYNDYSPLGWEQDTYNNPREYAGDKSNLEGKHIESKRIASGNFSSQEEKYKSTKHEGFGDYNDDYIPVYNNNIDYTGDFSRANLSKLSNEELTSALNKQSELYDEAVNERLGDQRTRNGKMDKIFNTAKKQKYESGMSAINNEMKNRNMPRYNIYDDNGMVRVSSPTKEMAEKQLAEMREIDKKLQKEYGWDKLPDYIMAEEYKTGFEEKKKESYEEYVQRVLNNDDYLQANRPNAYFNKMVKETPYIKTLEKHNLNNSDPEFKRSMLGRLESDVNYYMGSGGGYSGHLWAKDEKEQIDLMKALYNTLPEKEKPDWINESKIDEYSKQMDFIKNNKDITKRYSGMFEYLKQNTLMSEIEIIKFLKDLEKKQK